MKKIYKFITIILLPLSFFSACELDEEAPGGKLYGTILTTSGGVLSGDNKRELATVSIALKSDKKPIKLRVKPDGTYARSILVEGTYTASFSGPFFPIESQTVNVNGTVKLDVKVVPFLEYKLGAGELTSTTAKFSYTVKANNGAKPSRKVIVWSELPYPTVYDYKYTGRDGGRIIDSGAAVMVNKNGEQSGSYTISGLKPNTTYYVRAGGRTDNTPVTPNPSSLYNYSNQIIIKTAN